ncbi:MAG: Ig-like domain-containing protein [Patescibacteria group bacterium]
MKRLSIFFVIFCLFLNLPIITRAAELEPSLTSFKTSKTTVRADGIDQVLVTVRVRDVNRLAMEGVKVKLLSSRGETDEISPAEDLSNGFGEAKFYVKSLKNGTAELSAVVKDIYNSPTSISIKFEQGLELDLEPGTLIKIPSDDDPYTYSDTAVYYFASNGKRYVFPNEKVYFTWYSSFENVRVISLEDMTKIPIGGNVTYRPGSKPVKFQTDNKVYGVYQNGELRWIPTEEMARAIYGENWMSMVDDISEAFYVNYKIGPAIDHYLDFPANTIFNKYFSIEKDKNI